MRREAKSQGCILPPLGWFCTREPGHEGPCAAIAYRPILAQRLREQALKHIDEETHLITHGGNARLCVLARGQADGLSAAASIAEPYDWAMLELLDICKEAAEFFESVDAATLEHHGEHRTLHLYSPDPILLRLRRAIKKIEGFRKEIGPTDAPDYNGP